MSGDLTGLCLYILLHVICEDEFVQMNFQSYENERLQTVKFMKNEKYVCIY